MADLHSLIRLRKYRVEEKQKILADLFREAEKYEAAIKNLEDQHDKEKALAEEKGDYETVTAYAMFAERVRQQVAFLHLGLDKINARVAVAQEAMRDAFSELKKIEIIQETRDEDELKKELKREGEVLDEVALEGFRRNKAE